MPEDMMDTKNTIALIGELNTSLTGFLQRLQPAQWLLPTVARKWNVKDVAAHLLDGNFRRIAIHRDGWMPKLEESIESSEQLINYLNNLNADWVKATRRLSPEIIIQLLETTNEEIIRVFSALDPQKEAVFPVSWAGENVSTNGFDIAREYTERWLHQQQIRDACKDTILLSAKFYKPCLDIFLRALPVAMGSTGNNEMTVKLTVTGEGGGCWGLKRINGKWMSVVAGDEVVTEVIVNGSVAWKLFSKSVRKKEIAGEYQITGDKELGEKMLDMVSVMA